MDRDRESNLKMEREIGLERKFSLMTIKNEATTCKEVDIALSGNKNEASHLLLKRLFQLQPFA